MGAYLLYSVFLTAFVYPITAHAFWSENGFLSPFTKEPLGGIGTVDFAGAGVVHMTGGLTALVSAWILGPRAGRFHDVKTGELLNEPKTMPGHSIAHQLLGSMILWFGWYGFNTGSALLLTDNTVSTGEIAGHVTIVASLCGASGCDGALVINMILKYRVTQEFNFDLLPAMNGALSGLVASAGCAGLIQE